MSNKSYDASPKKFVWKNKGEAVESVVLPGAPSNNSIGNELKKMSSSLVVRSSLSGQKRQYRSPEDWVEDGVDHINIDSNAATDLGRMLSGNYNARWSHELFENFLCLDGFWNYIRSVERDDKLRGMFGQRLKEHSRELTNRPLRHFRAVLIDSQYQRILCLSKLHRLMMENELPFDSYYVNHNGLKKRSNNHDWMIEGHTAIQTAIHRGVEPDLSFLCDGQTSDIYESVRPKIPPHMLERQQQQQRQRETDRAANVAKVSKPQVKKEAPIQKPTKVKGKGLTYTAGQGCLLVPSVAVAPEAFLGSFKSTVVVNGVSIETEPLLADVGIPLLPISQNQELENMGLISPQDVVKVGAFRKEMFETTGHSEIGRINAVVINSGENPMFIPVWHKLSNRVSVHPNDVQNISFHDASDDVGDRTTVVTRDVLLFRPIAEITSAPGKASEVMGRLLEAAMLENNMTNNQVIEKPLKWVGLRLRFKYSYRYNHNPFVYFSGLVQVESFASGPTTDKEQEVLLLSEPVVFTIDAFTTTMYRGVVRVSEIVEKETVVTEESATIIDTGIEASVDEQVVPVVETIFQETVVDSEESNVNA